MTQFLESLQRVDPRTREARAAQGYLAVKGYADFSPLGVVPVASGDCWYFYYRLPDGLLELEVVRDGNTYTRTVTALIEDEQRVASLLELLAS